jgi:hypothetical protein
LDILINAWPMVKMPKMWVQESYMCELVRQGTIVQYWTELNRESIFGQKIGADGMNRGQEYFGAGAGLMHDPYRHLQDKHCYPSLGKIHWSRPGDGHFHMAVRELDPVKYTVAKRQTSGVSMVNWHPGPLGVPGIIDPFLWTCMMAAATVM